jgi:hypothetical protein
MISVMIASVAARIKHRERRQTSAKASAKTGERKAVATLLRLV